MSAMMRASSVTSMCDMILHPGTQHGYMPGGAVRVVEIEGESVPPSLELCVRQEAAHWTFPPPGGPMTFDLPLRFRTRQ
jgi:hypothetical protein